MRACFLRQACSVAALAAAAAFTSVASPTAHAADELNVYNWSDTSHPTRSRTSRSRRASTSEYDNYDSDDTLQAKLLAGSSGYDIVVPTSNYMAKQIQAGVYQKLDKSKLPNLANLDPLLMKMISDADPGNQYGVLGVRHGRHRLQRAGGEEGPRRQGAGRQLGAGVRSGQHGKAEELRRVVPRPPSTCSPPRCNTWARIRTARIPATTRLRSKS